MGGEQFSVIEIPHLNVACPFSIGNRRHIKGSKNLLDSEEGFVKIKQRHIEEIILLGIDKDGARMGDLARHLIDFAILGKGRYFFYPITEIEFEILHLHDVGHTKQPAVFDITLHVFGL